MTRQPLSCGTQKNLALPLKRFRYLCVALSFVTLLWVGAVRGDQVEMLNGDRYVGQVLSLGTDTLVVQSEVLGTLRLPRTRISTITLDSSATGAVTNIARPPGRTSCQKRSACRD